MLRTGMTIAATLMWLAGSAIAQQQPPTAPPPPDFSKVEAKLVKDGKSEDDVMAAKPFSDLDAKWAPTELASKNFIRVVYHSLADKKAS